VTEFAALYVKSLPSFFSLQAILKQRHAFTSSTPTSLYGMVDIISRSDFAKAFQL